MYSLKYSSKSLQLSIKSFLRFVNSPNLNNGFQMLKAANFSGKAINIARTNAPHALSYFFTSKFKILHGIAVSIFFIEIINLFYFNAYKKNNINLIKKFNLFFKLTKQSHINGFNNLFHKFLLDSGIKKHLEKSLKKIKYRRNSNFYHNSKRLDNSPIKILKDDIDRLYLNKFKS